MKATKLFWAPLLVSLLSGSAAHAQASSPLFGLPISPDVVAQNFAGPGSTILPTDVVPLPGGEDRSTFNEKVQLRVLQQLPSKFYFAGIVESSFRNETNVFQYPTKRQLLRKFPKLDTLSTSGQYQVLQVIRNASQNDNVYRVLPNVTAGWAFTPRTRVFSNYFLIRDSLMHYSQLNTTTQSVGGALQHDIPLGDRTLLQGTLQFRELFQTNQINVFDYIPNITLSRTVGKNRRLVLFTSVLLQMRGKQPFVSPNRELDPFYNVGAIYRRGLWQATAQGTFVQNFRKNFGQNALLPINNDQFIADFEIARQVKKIPGMQAFIRAEPIWSFHSNNTPGLAGMDFRLFYGLRMTVGKPAIGGTVKDIQKLMEEQEVRPPQPVNSDNSKKKKKTAPSSSPAAPAPSTTPPTTSMNPQLAPITLSEASDSASSATAAVGAEATSAQVTPVSMSSIKPL